MRGRHWTGSCPLAACDERERLVIVVPATEEGTFFLRRLRERLIIVIPAIEEGTFVMRLLQFSSPFRATSLVQPHCTSAPRLYIQPHCTSAALDTIFPDLLRVKLACVRQPVVVAVLQLVRRSSDDMCDVACHVSRAMCKGKKLDTNATGYCTFRCVRRPCPGSC